MTENNFPCAEMILLSQLSWPNEERTQELDEAICERLAQRGLAVRGEGGRWELTQSGRFAAATGRSKA